MSDAIKELKIGQYWASTPFADVQPYVEILELIPGWVKYCFHGNGSDGKTPYAITHDGFRGYYKFDVMPK